MVPKDIKKLIDMKAYAEGMVYGENEKKRLQAELERLQSDELLLPELKKFLKKLGAG